jgi:pimeloyl-ACP methyl ester carboxylesterase
MRMGGCLPKYMAKKLNCGIMNSSLHIIKDSGHFCFLEKPLEFNLIANEFLRG